MRRHWKVSPLVTKPTSVNAFLCLWWVLLIATGVVGLLGAPSANVIAGAGEAAARFIV